jgi:hypothetical protein
MSDLKKRIFVRFVARSEKSQPDMPAAVEIKKYLLFAWRYQRTNVVARRAYAARIKCAANFYWS